jgi:SAM-dependent methyltransferase
MQQDSFIPVFNWAIAELTVAERLETLKPLWKHIAPLAVPGGRALNLCCGSGAAAFLLEEAGMAVTAVDSSPRLIELAREEARRRGSAVELVQADVLGYELEANNYDLALALGNPLLDFPPERFGPFRDSLAKALKPGAHAVFEYYDGVVSHRKWSEPAERITEREPEEIASRYLGYEAALGAFKLELHNRTRDEKCIYHGYVYTIPLLRQLLAPRFTLKRSHSLSDYKFLDVHVRD